ncbi:MAG: DRTGG domain-containing protein [Desulfotomaculaceae bacterium]|nr:DRTGG domain-containing protein [Desulfotomaculaceae bacterium]
MTLLEVKKVLNATCVTQHCLDARVVETACGADLMSDVLSHDKEKAVLLTGLIHPQVIRTASMIDIVCVVFVRDKIPGQDIIDLAEINNIPVLCTKYPLYESCGLLYKAGLGVISSE